MDKGTLLNKLIDNEEVDNCGLIMLGDGRECFVRYTVFGWKMKIQGQSFYYRSEELTDAINEDDVVDIVFMM